MAQTLSESDRLKLSEALKCMRKGGKVMKTTLSSSTCVLIFPYIRHSHKQPTINRRFTLDSRGRAFLFNRGSAPHLPRQISLKSYKKSNRLCCAFALHFSMQVNSQRKGEVLHNQAFAEIQFPVHCNGNWIVCCNPNYTDTYLQNFLEGPPPLELQNIQKRL